MTTPEGSPRIIGSLPKTAEEAGAMIAGPTSPDGSFDGSVTFNFNFDADREAAGRALGGDNNVPRTPTGKPRDLSGIGGSPEPEGLTPFHDATSDSERAMSPTELNRLLGEQRAAGRSAVGGTGL